METHNGYFQQPCRKRVLTRAGDINAADFTLKVLVQTGAAPDTADIRITVRPAALFGDVQALMQTASAALYIPSGAENAAASVQGPLIGSASGRLEVSFSGIELPSITGAATSWRLELEAVQIRARDGKVMTLPRLSKTFTHPL